MWAHISDYCFEECESEADMNCLGRTGGDMNCLGRTQYGMEG